MKTRIIGVVACWITAALLWLPPVAFAQGDVKTTPSTPAGIGVLILVLGLGAIISVGGYYIMQNRPPRPDSADEDE